MLALIYTLAMSKDPKKNTVDQRKFKEKMRETHKNFSLWIPHEDLADIEAIAEANGWLNETGRNTGKPNLQKTIMELLREGIAQKKETGK